MIARANAVGVSLDYKTKVTRESKLLVRGYCSGLVPAPLNANQGFELSMSMMGPAATEDATAEELAKWFD